MAHSRTKSIYCKSWSIILAETDVLEAPDRNFIGHRDIVTRSLARYHFIAPYICGTLLDVGCGRGYGFDILQQHSNMQVGVDISLDFLRIAQARLSKSMVTQTAGDTLPFLSDSFDAIIAFEVIEHIQNDRGFLLELRRLASNNAFIAISTPNKIIASGSKEKPLNRFHVREYTVTEFYKLLSSVFSTVDLFGQHERSDNPNAVNSFIDHIPIHWKYVLPAHVQDLISVILRPPLRLEDCRFLTDNLERSHTLVALCRL
jgi:SAM-dependent methyltransferase